MKRFLIVSLLSLVAVVSSSDTASAQFPANYGFFPWGFYQPYGARYGNASRTPPYFATNPPVYYGARHARPYGLSPFASPPLVLPGERYKSRLRTQFLQPRVPTPAPLCNPYVSQSEVVKPPSDNGAAKTDAANRDAGETVVAGQVELGPVRANPFVDLGDRIAKK